MAENDAQSAAAPPADSHSVLQERLSQASLDPNRDPAVQPFPRSPSRQRTVTQAAQPSRVGSCKSVNGIQKALRRRRGFTLCLTAGELGFLHLFFGDIMKLFGTSISTTLRMTVQPCSSRAHLGGKGMKDVRIV